MNQPTQQTEPTDNHLYELHMAYQAFMADRPWQELTDRNPFVIRHPDDNEQACCVVMGHWAREFGVAMYRGEAGMTAYRKTILGDEQATRQCWTIAATTGHRSLVDDREKRRIRRMGIRYSGNSNWPIWFASFPAEPASPNLPPRNARRNTRNINDQEAVFLTLALKAANDIAAQARAGRLHIHTDDRPDPQQDPVPALESTLQTDGSWNHQPFDFQKRPRTPPTP